MVTRIFDMADQRWFAARSGDWNPLHVDALKARRLLFGGAVVHGMHVVMWAIDEALATRKRAGRIVRLNAKFDNPLLVGAEATIDVDDPEAEQVQVLVRGERECASISLDFSDGSWENDNGLPVGKPPTAPPLVRTIEDVDGLQGKLALYRPAQDLAAAYPVLLKRLGKGGVSALLASSRLVGIECPGLHSIFGGLDVTFSDTGGAASLDYKVVRADRRFSMVSIQLDGSVARGQARAFMRPAPVEQPGSRQLKQQVNRDEFAGHKVLVIGGSRGLGEVAAKIIGAGGGEVILTYHLGAEEASRIVEDIETAGGRARAICFDATAGRNDLRKSLDTVQDLNGVLYFSAPKIVLGKPRIFNAALFRMLSDMFVSAPCNVATEIASRCCTSALQFYPSTTFLDRPGDGGTEYCAAKAAGEVAWQQYAAAYPDLRFVAERLPPLQTDQTADLQGGHAAEPAPVILDLLRRHLGGLKSAGRE